jgi:hypothetical protein
MATPTAPIPQSPDWKDVLEFVRKQGAEDRAYFDHIFKRTTWGVSLILGVGLAVDIPRVALARRCERTGAQPNAGGDQ